jgi:hypothetical protein
LAGQSAKTRKVKARRQLFQRIIFNEVDQTKLADIIRALCNGAQPLKQRIIARVVKLVDDAQEAQVSRKAGA